MLHIVVARPYFELSNNVLSPLVFIAHDYSPPTTNLFRQLAKLLCILGFPAIFTCLQSDF